MRYSFLYPMHFKGRLRRGTNVKDVILADRVSGDIPEISAGETDLVFECLETRAEGFAPYRPCRSYAGRLYRRIAESREEVAARGLFDHAWRMETHERSHHAFGGDLSHRREDGNEKTRPNPPRPHSRAIQEQISWDIRRADPRSTWWDDVWPTRLSGLDVEPQNALLRRDAFLFNDLRDRIADYSHADYERSRRMMHAQTAKFLFIEDELWIETPPPVLVVETGSFRNVPSMAEDFAFYPDVVDISLAFAPEWMDYDLTRQYFPLRERDAAIDYARELSAYCDARNASRGSGPLVPFGIIRDHTVKHVLHDAETCRFDHDEDLLARVSHGMAIQNMATLKRLRARGAEPTGADAVEAAFTATASTNHVFGHRADLADWFEPNAAFWVAGRRSQTLFRFGPSMISDRLVARARAAIEKRPIALPGAFP